MKHTVRSVEMKENGFNFQISPTTHSMVHVKILTLVFHFLVFIIVALLHTDSNLHSQSSLQVTCKLLGTVIF